MKQAQMSYNQQTKKGHVSHNYKGNIFEEFKEAAYNLRINETLAAYENINRKQGVTREQLVQKG